MNLKRKAEQLAEAYATGNHRVSFPDTHDERAYLTGFLAACEMHARLVEACELVRRHKDYEADEILHKAYEKFRKEIE